MRRGSIRAALAATLAGLLVAVPLAAGAHNTRQDVVVSAGPVDWTPHVADGRVLAFAQVGDRIVVGGDFTAIRDDNRRCCIAQPYLFAFDATSGRIDPAFRPRLDGSVQALAPSPDGHSVIAGGYFKTVNGARHRRLVTLDVATGQVADRFQADVAGAVRDLAVAGNRLFIGGVFSAVNRVGRQRLAALDATTGALDPGLDLPVTTARDGTLHVRALDVSPDGSRLVLVGNFREVAGQRREQIALVDVASSPARLAGWETLAYQPQCAAVFDTYMRDVDFSPDGSYFVVVTTGAHFDGTLCDTAARWEAGATGTGLSPTWVDFTGGDTLHSAAVTGEAVYVGGHQRWMNNPGARDAAGPSAVERPGIAALDPVNGMPLTWNPGRTRGIGAEALLATATGLWVGSDTEWLGGEYHQRVGMFPVAGGHPLPEVAPPALPGDLFVVGPGDALAKRRLEDGGVGAPTPVGGGVDWSGARGVTMLAGQVVYGGSDGRLRSRSFDGSSFGPARDLGSWLSFAGVTAMFWWRGRLYYTVAGDPRLLYRYFSPESGYVGGERFVAGGGGVDWLLVRGLTLAGDWLYVARADGNLVRVRFSGGQPVPGSAQTVSGPATGDGADWRVDELFTRSA